jgi:hypothetical protein
VKFLKQNIMKNLNELLNEVQSYHEIKSENFTEEKTKWLNAINTYLGDGKIEPYYSRLVELWGLLGLGIFEDTLEEEEKETLEDDKEMYIEYLNECIAEAIK